jgi:hypothetical protein
MGIGRLTVALPAVVLAVVLVACGGTDDGAAPDEGPTPDPVEADGEGVEDPDAEPATDAASDGDADASGSWCDWLDTAEVEAMFDGVLELTDQRPVNDRSCQWTIVGAEGEGLLTTEVTPGTAEILLQQGKDQDVPLEEPDLGAGAVLLNGADLTVIRPDATEFRIAVSAFFAEAEQVPDAAAVRAGILELGAAVLEGTS